MEITGVLHVCEVFNELAAEPRKLGVFMLSSSKSLYA
jgi:hypothetical protein